MNKRLPPPIQRTSKLAIIRDIPDVYLMRRRIGRTTRQPFTVGAETHRVPCCAVDGVVEAVGGFELVVYEWEGGVGWCGR